LKKFSLSEADLGVMEEWVEKLAIRWGRDGGQKEKLGLPPYGENTWRAGFDRLLLGYAMADRQELFASILPFGELAESDAGLLGRMLDAFSVLFYWLERLPAKRRGLAEWAQELQGLLGACFPEDREQEGEMGALRQALLSMSATREETGFNEELDLKVVKSWLHQLLRVEKSPRGFLSGGVTFCSLLPMRAIPFKVVCLLGMNDGDFPRPRIDLSFDLMSRNPRRGDRSPRLDDRYLFLEALLSARNQLYISYVGQSVRDDAVLPPSVLVSELVDCLADMCKARGGAERPGTDFVTRQRLQPFHPAYFQTGSPLFSYSAENLAAAKQLLAGGDPGAGFWTPLPLPLRENMAPELDLYDFVGFFLHPLRYFCRNRLGFELSAADEAPADSEPFSLTGLPLYQLETELLSRFVGKEDPQNSGLLWKARGALPHGRSGDIAVREVRKNVAGFYQRLTKYLAPPVEPPVFRMSIRDLVLCGRLEKMTENGLLHGRPARMKGKDLLRAWIMHLIANRLSPDQPCRSTVVARDRSVILRPVANSQELLEQLVTLFLQGLREPLPFFVETSYQYAVHACEGGMEKAYKAAHASWHGRNNGGGERDDVYIRFRFQNEQEEALGEAFAELAVKIFTPLFAHMEDDNG
jgi:exodeoxyribonuclease V gamma subunit